MVIAKKPERTEKEMEEKRERFLSKGGLVSADILKKQDKRKAILVRIPEDWLEKIDKAVEGRCGMSRTAWLLQAAQEKLERTN